MNMLRTYWILAWRNLVKDRFYSLLNIAGLALGLSFVLVIAIYITGQLRVNRQLANPGHQYMLQSCWKDKELNEVTSCMSPLLPLLYSGYPNLVKNYYRWEGNITASIAAGDKAFWEEVVICDSSLLNMYGFNLADGDKAHALSDPWSVVITAGMALKYYGRTDIAGQLLRVCSFDGTPHDFKITAVMGDIPPNTVTSLTGDADHPVNFFFPAANAPFFRRVSWQSWEHAIPCFIELHDQVQPKDLIKPVAALMRLHAPPWYAENFIPHAVALDRQYLESGNGAHQKMIFTLLLTALFILVLAIVNFVNLAVARAGRRYRETGIRKTYGAQRPTLMMQFVIESVLIAIAATLIAVLTTCTFIPVCGEILGTTLPSYSTLPGWFIMLIPGLALLTGIAAGLYPALILSGMPTLSALKGGRTSHGAGVLTRKVLVLLQFIIACIVLSSSFIISRQVAYFFSDANGYDVAGVVAIRTPTNWNPEGVRRMETVRNEFMQLARVKAATLSYSYPNTHDGSSGYMYPEGSDSSHAIHIVSMCADEYFAKTYGIEMLAGTFFNESGDTGQVVINAEEATAFGWQTAQEAIGKRLLAPGWKGHLTVVGVTANYHQETMDQPITPAHYLKLGLFFNVYRYLSVKITHHNTVQVIEALKARWNQLMPGVPFEYRFIDDTLKQVYASEIRMKKASYIATILSLVIVVMGIIGLVSFSVQKRAREIAIRKIAGAPVSHIIGLFLKEYLVIIAIALLVAIPAAYAIMRYWLSFYAYKTAITPLPFICAAALLLVLTGTTICIQTLWAAKRNPVKNLRHE